MKKLMHTLAVFLAGAGCSSSIVTGGSESGGTGGATTTTGTAAGTGTGASTGTGTTTETGCPAMLEDAASCAGYPDGLHCTYGDSVRPDCREEMTCTSGTWLSPHSACPPAPADCPSTEPSSTVTCANQGDVCTYGDTICTCNDCTFGPCQAPPITWQCAAPPTTAGCPPLAPNDGTACTVEGLMCEYGFVCVGEGTVANCTAGFWTWDQAVACEG